MSGLRRDIAALDRLKDQMLAFSRSGMAPESVAAATGTPLTEVKRLLRRHGHIPYENALYRTQDGRVLRGKRLIAEDYDAGPVERLHGASLGAAKAEGRATHERRTRPRAASGHYVETRLPAHDLSGGGGLPWTREGCNSWADGRFVPHATLDAARATVERLRAQDDPTWRRAEYRVVPSKGRTR